jgi:hypothetical protein
MIGSARHRFLPAASILLIAIAPGCNCTKGEPQSGQPADPIVLPPTLERVLIEPPSIEQQVVSRIAVTNPASVPFIQIDTYTQGPGTADILFIIDNNGSMAIERTVLAGNFQRFFNELVAAQTNFQIGVTSVSMAATSNPLFNDPNQTGYQGTLRQVVVNGLTTSIITNNTANPSQVFLAATTFPDTHLRWSQTFTVMETALTPPLTNPGQPNAGFVRPGAALGVIVVTNEDDQSFGTVGFYARFLRSAKGIGNENLSSFSAIAGDVPNGCTPPGQENFFGSEAEPAYRYQDLAFSTGGVFGSICNPTFEQTLDQIAEALKTLRKIFPLSLMPAPTSISVTVNGAAIAQDPVNGWTYQANINSIIFAGNYVPPPGSTIVIEYVVMG